MSLPRRGKEKLSDLKLASDVSDCLFLLWHSLAQSSQPRLKGRGMPPCEGRLHGGRSGIDGVPFGNIPHLPFSPMSLAHMYAAGQRGSSSQPVYFPSENHVMERHQGHGFEDSHCIFRKQQ